MATARTHVHRNARTLERLVRSTLGGTALAIVATGSLVAQKPGPVNLKDFDAYVAKAMKDWKVPGMAIAIVRNDSIVLAKGYGVRKLGEATPRRATPEDHSLRQLS